MTRQTRHRTVIAQKERQIGKLRDEVERLRKILLERDTGTGENRETVLPKNRNTEKPTNRNAEKPDTDIPRQGETDEREDPRTDGDRALRLLISFWTE
ncbi:hypothetical protein [Bifidobacterium pseudocatenulatum]|uniref:hypothetical protein n=1 Tax=Bifidobacterium pseudocatenulatum TaxID=28026 RepID=UPI00216AC3DF|nr:hypothetical protein [Bifidobacterium pseudocatenulatum]